LGKDRTPPHWTSKTSMAERGKRQGKKIRVCATLQEKGDDVEERWDKLLKKISERRRKKEKTGPSIESRDGSDKVREGGG